MIFFEKGILFPKKIQVVGKCKQIDDHIPNELIEILNSKKIKYHLKSDNQLYISTFNLTLIKKLFHDYPNNNIGKISQIIEVK